jgi:hypothetical protein
VKKRGRSSKTPWSTSVVVDPMRRQCTATARSGDPCRNIAVAGAFVCRFHGGAAPQVQAKAAVRLIEHEVRETLERLGAPEPLGHPVEELLALGAEAREWLRILRERVSDLEGEGLSAWDQHGTDQARAVVGLYERAIDRTAGILTSLVKLDLGERMVRLKEDQARIMFACFMTVLKELALSPEQVSLARQVFARELRAVSTPPEGTRELPQ